MGQPITFVAVQLRDLDLSRISARAPNFDRSKLTGVNFEFSNIDYASFVESVIDRSSFGNAMMNSANFSGAMIDGAQFSDARLSRAIFDHAVLKNVDFSRADVRNASFRNTKFQGDELPKFRETAWWLATGWSLQQVEQLAAQYPSVVGVDEPRLDQIQRMEARIKVAPPASIEKALALNDTAWWLATMGNDLLAAEGFARQALGILQHSKPRGERMDFEDTLGYILLQQHNPSGAADVLAENQNPESMFKFAVALYALGRTDESLRYLTLAIDQKKYMPSHELYLLRSYITGEFREQLQRLIDKR